MHEKTLTSPRDILRLAKNELTSLDNFLIDVIDIKRPQSIAYAKNLAKVISKLSPLLGNMIEFSTIDLLNNYSWEEKGEWIRQDPGFPDALFQSNVIKPNPGIEIKAWFPFATEITARFKDSVTMFANDNIDVALIAWIPENIIWGKPKIIDALVVSGKSVAEARDKHYHKPPKYIVVEPEDTSERTANLQQTNTNGYKLQEDKCSLQEAQAFVKEWGKDYGIYSPDLAYQQRLKTLYGKFVYRLDTNYAKIDRIEHAEIEKFKDKILKSSVHGKTIKQWGNILLSDNDRELENALKAIL